MPASRPLHPARVTVALAAAAAGLLAPVAATAPAAAADTPWNPSTHALAELPASSVDGEITVTMKGTDTAGDEMKSFTSAGAPVAYKNDAKGYQDYQWGPAGDVVSVYNATATVHTITTTDQGELLSFSETGRSSRWSPFGDGRAANYGGGVSGAVPSLIWESGGGVTSLTEGGSAASTFSVAPGVPAPTADGRGVVVNMASGQYPDVSRDIGIAPVELPVSGNHDVDAPVVAPTPLGYQALQAHDPAVASDGTLAFIGHEDGGTGVYVDEGTGARKVATLSASCPGQRPAFAPSSSALAYVTPVDGQCASSELRTITKVDGSFVGGTDALVTTSSGRRLENASWRAKTPAAQGERLGGADRVAVGISTSQWAYPDADQAPGVVLASSENFADSVIASPLSGQTGMPLLINPSRALDKRVRAEIARLLQPGDPIVVVGGPASINDTVLVALEKDGYDVVRVAEPDRFTTSVAVAEFLDALWAEDPDVPRTSVFLADGLNFPDALVGGPAAAQFFAPVLLTRGTSVPAPVKAYVTGRSTVTKVYSIGGAAVTAGKAAFGTKSKEVTGKDRYQVSANVARRFFPGAGIVGVASGKVFPDALTGGALMGMLGQPIVLSSGNDLPIDVNTALRRYRPGTDHVLVFGGTATVTDRALQLAATIAAKQNAYYGPTVPRVPNPRATAGAAEQQRYGLGADGVAGATTLSGAKGAAGVTPDLDAALGSVAR